jgi:D-alanyl-D-alanine carboxypeptidase
MALTATRAPAEALLVIEAESGKVLYAANAAYPWYPASVTKVMTAYAVLRAVKEGSANARDRTTGVAGGSRSAAGQDGISSRHVGHRR